MVLSLNALNIFATMVKNKTNYHYFSFFQQLLLPNNQQQLLVVTPIISYHTPIYTENYFQNYSCFLVFILLASSSRFFSFYIAFIRLTSNVAIRRDTNVCFMIILRSMISLRRRQDNNNNNNTIVLKKRWILIQE